MADFWVTFSHFPRLFNVPFGAETQRSNFCKAPWLLSLMFEVSLSFKKNYLIYCCSVNTKFTHLWVSFWSNIVFRRSWFLPNRIVPKRLYLSRSFCFLCSLFSEVICGRRAGEPRSQCWVSFLCCSVLILKWSLTETEAHPFGLLELPKASETGATIPLELRLQAHDYSSN